MTEFTGDCLSQRRPPVRGTRGLGDTLRGGSPRALCPETPPSASGPQRAPDRTGRTPGERDRGTPSTLRGGPRLPPEAPSRALGRRCIIFHRFFYPLHRHISIVDIDIANLREGSSFTACCFAISIWFWMPSRSRDIGSTSSSSEVISSHSEPDSGSSRTTMSRFLSSIFRMKVSILGWFIT